MMIFLLVITLAVALMALLASLLACYGNGRTRADLNEIGQLINDCTDELTEVVQFQSRADRVALKQTVERCSCFVPVPKTALEMAMDKTAAGEDVTMEDLARWSGMRTTLGPQ